MTLPQITEKNDKALSERLKGMAADNAGRMALVDFALFSFTNHDKPEGKAALKLIGWFGGFTLGNVADIRALNDSGYSLFLRAMAWIRETGDEAFAAKIGSAVTCRIMDREHEIKIINQSTP